MAFSFDAILGSRFAIRLTLGMGRAVPRRLGHRLATSLGRVVARSRLSAAQAVRVNQWIASGGSLDPDELERRVKETLAHGLRAQYDLYHHFHDPEAVVELVDLDAGMEHVLERNASGEEGTIVVGPHLGYFDLAMHSLGLRGWDAQVLTVPHPGGGYRVQNEQRVQSGLEVTPISKEALKSALNRLRDGGTVLTGLDRPAPSSRHRPRFFGREAALPVAHVWLALTTGVPVYVAGSRRAIRSVCSPARMPMRIRSLVPNGCCRWPRT